jgi:hypothetical protein
MPDGVAVTTLEVTPEQAELLRDAYAEVQRSQQQFALLFGMALRGHGHRQGRFVGLEANNLVVLLEAPPPAQ